MGLFWNFSWRQRELLQITTGGADISSLINIASSLWKKKDLQEVIDDSGYEPVREAARQRLICIESLSRKELRQLKKRERNQYAIDQANKKAQEAEKATPGTPAYFASKGDIAACAACGPPAIPHLLQLYIGENSVGMDKIDNALLAFGPMAYSTVEAFTHAVLNEYIGYTSTIKSIDYSFDSDRQKAAVIKTFAEKLQRLIRLCAGYGVPALSYIPLFYTHVYTKVYSDPSSAFNDLFDAVQVRRSAVSATGRLDFNTYAPQLTDFYAKALQDESHFVRWACIDILHELDHAYVRQSHPLQQGLAYAMKNEPNTVSSRKAKIQAILK